MSGSEIETLQLLPTTTTEAEQNNKEAPPKIGRQDASIFSYNDFYWNYMHKNWPVIITNISNEWKCRCDWTKSKKSSTYHSHTETKRTAINFDFLRNNLENSNVPVANCSREYFNSHLKSEMKFYDFLDYWEAKIQSEGENEEKHMGGNGNEQNLYLKDWHLKGQKPNYNFYKVPKQFASDWLNEQCISTGTDDYRFVYMGPTGSWTPFHADVFGSYSWSTNIVGCKKWLLFPPGEELKLRDRLGNLPFCVDETTIQKSKAKHFTIMQEENEALFVPSGWYHQVTNLTDTISINHNWFNACNIEKVWHNLTANMRQVIAEIEDCRQMENFTEQCQTVLRANFGMNYNDFLEMLEFIIKRRIDNRYRDNNNEEVAATSNFLFFETYAPNDFHVRYDLQTIKKLLEIIKSDPIVLNDCPADLSYKCGHLQQMLTKRFH